MQIASSDSRGSRLDPKRQKAPSACAVSAGPEFFSHTFSGPTTLPRGPARIASCTFFCSGENFAGSSSGRRAIESPLFVNTARELPTGLPAFAGDDKPCLPLYPPAKLGEAGLKFYS